MIRSTAAVALGVFALAAGSASAATPKTDTITAVGRMQVKANQYVQDAQRWDADSYDVKSGDTVTLRDKSTEGQPHTLSLGEVARAFIDTVARGPHHTLVGAQQRRARADVIHASQREEHLAVGRGRRLCVRRHRLL